MADNATSMQHRPGPARAPAWRYSVVAGGFTLTWLLLDQATHSLQHSATPSHWHLGGGLALAIVIGLGWRWAWLVPVGATLSRILVGGPVETGVVVSLEVALLWSAVYIGAGLFLRQVVHVDLRRASVVDIGAFGIVALCLAPLLGGLVDAGIPALAGEHTAHGPSLLGIAAGESVGALTLTPVTLAAVVPYLRRFLRLPLDNAFLVNTWFRPQLSTGEAIECSLQLAATATIVWFATIVGTHPELLALVSLPLAWVGLRNGYRRTALAVFVGGVTLLFAGNRDPLVAGELPHLEVVLTTLGFTALLTGAAVSQRRSAQQRLENSRGDLAEAQRIAGIGSWACDLRSGEWEISEEVFAMWGRSKREVDDPVAMFVDSVHEDDRQRVQTMWRGVVDRGEAKRVEFRLVRPNGEVREVDWRPRLVYDEAGTPVRLLGTVHDITEQKEEERRLAREADTDPTTGLPNRAPFVRALCEAMSETAPGTAPDVVDVTSGDPLATSVEGTVGSLVNGRACAVLFVGLDDFNMVNESLGHEAGDLLLFAVAQRLQDAVGDEATVARFSGESFTILLENITSHNDAVDVADRIQDVLHEPFDLFGRDLYVEASIGIAFTGVDWDSPEDLLRNANYALRKAREKPNARYAIFGSDMSREAMERLELDTDLRHAIENQEFLLHYQPFVEARSGRVIGAEALVRWARPGRGMESPGIFIPFAEETWLIVPIGRFVLNAAMHEAVSWPTPPGGPPLRVAVNLSARQLHQPDLVGWIGTLLANVGLPPTRLELEITESAVMHDAEAAIATLHKLKDLGCHLAIDDFGTGYSSLSYLKRIKADTLKIDRSFVMGIGRGSEDEAILEASVALAHRLGMSVTAEGVETPEQFARLRELGCELLQGYYFAKPMPPEEFEELVAADRCWSVPVPALQEERG